MDDFGMMEMTEEIWSDMAPVSDEDTCYCGNETVSGNVMPEHTVGEHNAVYYAADQCPEHGFDHDPEQPVDRALTNTEVL
jgi:hypothetical protein